MNSNERSDGALESRLEYPQKVATRARGNFLTNFVWQLVNAELLKERSKR